jgi:hypothetical protein
VSTRRISWSSGAYATEYGKIRAIPLFTISYKTKRTDPDWTLRCSLPGLRDELGKFDTMDQAKDRAEHALVEFIEKLGAKF